jgi:hypothetical protein
MTVRTRTKIAFLRKFQVCRLAKRWQILRSNADFQAVSAFLHTLGQKRTFQRHKYRSLIALLSDPGGTSMPSHCGISMRPSPFIERRLPRYGHFEAQSHGLHARCLRFAAPVTRTPRKTRFRLGGSLYRAGSYPRGFLRHFMTACAVNPKRPNFA